MSQSSPFDGRVSIFSADGRPMVRLEQSWPGTRYPLAEPRAGSTQEWSLVRVVEFSLFPILFRW